MQEDRKYIWSQCQLGLMWSGGGKYYRILAYFSSVISFNSFTPRQTKQSVKLNREAYGVGCEELNPEEGHSISEELYGCGCFVKHPCGGHKLVHQDIIITSMNTLVLTRHHKFPFASRIHLISRCDLCESHMLWLRMPPFACLSQSIPQVQQQVDVPPIHRVPLWTANDLFDGSKSPKYALARNHREKCGFQPRYTKWMSDSIQTVTNWHPMQLITHDD